MSQEKNVFPARAVIACLACAVMASSSALAGEVLVRTIDSTGDAGKGCSATALNGKVAVSYLSGTDVKLWHDQDGDLQADPGEISTIASASGYKTSITVLNNKLAVFFPLVSLYLWYDDNGNNSFDPGEIRTIDTGGGDFCDRPSATVLNGKLAVSYAVSGFSSPEFRLWYDADGGLTATSDEIRKTMDAYSNGMFSAATVVDGLLAVTAYSGGGTSLWIDLNGNQAVDTGEVRTIDTSGFGQSSVTTFENKLAVAFQSAVMQEAWKYRLRFWYDADGNYEAASSERKEIESLLDTAITGYGNSIVAWNGRLGVSYIHRDNTLRLWYDDNGNQAVDTGEIRTVENTGGALFEGFTSGVPMTPGVGWIVAYYHRADEDLKIAVFTGGGSPPGLPPPGGGSSVVTGSPGGGGGEFIRPGGGFGALAAVAAGLALVMLLGAGRRIGKARP